MSDSPALQAAWQQAVVQIEERGSATFGRLIEALSGPEARLAKRPATDRWSPLEIGEHLLLADRYLMLLVRKILEKSAKRAAAGEPWPAHAPDLTRLEALLHHPRMWENPPHMTPTGKLPRDRIQLGLAQDRDFFRTALHALPPGQGTLHRIRMSVIEGENRLDAYQYLLVIALHAERHLAQLQDALRPLR